MASEVASSSSYEAVGIGFRCCRGCARVWGFWHRGDLEGDNRRGSVSVALKGLPRNSILVRVELKTPSREPARVPMHVTQEGLVEFMEL